ncbi:MAG: CpsD/CapB family tyrosine-protein kinase [Oscillospiraceae bacterium]|nr:CpsD/CapB family tyrosine-protein kinase [Oscillospiraceae bacterium]
MNEKSSFETVETYKAIRTNVMFSMPKTDNGKVIVVTSSAPGEGKTTTSINLAITFAQMGAKVMLIDCDLRKSRVHRYLGLERKNGISNVLCGFSNLDKAIKVNVRENLDVLPAGEIPPNPAELMETEEFKNLIAELQKRYDYIFIDTPPITVVTDAAIAMKYSMGTIVVIRQDVTTFDMMDAAMESIKTTGVKILGAIMLGAEQKSKKYGYYKNGKYGYKYGYNYTYDYKYEDDDKDS